MGMLTRPVPQAIARTGPPGQPIMAAARDGPAHPDRRGAMLHHHHAGKRVTQGQPAPAGQPLVHRHGPPGLHDRG